MLHCNDGLLAAVPIAMGVLLLWRRRGHDGSCAQEEQLEEDGLDGRGQGLGPGLGGGFVGGRLPEEQVCQGFP